MSCRKNLLETLQPHPSRQHRHAEDARHPGNTHHRGQNRMNLKFEISDFKKRPKRNNISGEKAKNG